MAEINPRFATHRFRARMGFVLSLFGFFVYVLGADPALFGLDRSPVTGVVQILVFLVGLAILCLGGSIAMNAVWDGGEKTILADVGLRLVSTGYIIAVASGMADLIGFGSQGGAVMPRFGMWQEVGVMIGEAVIALGFILAIPFKRSPPA